MRRPLTLLGALISLALLRASPSHAEEPSAATVAPSYAPVPPRIAALVGTARDEERTRAALVSIEDADPTTAARAVRDLLLAGEVGLRGAVERLASGTCRLAVRLALLPVVAASLEPEVDVVLAAGALETRPELRMLAAHALGAGRSGLAVETLVRLLDDPVSGVRAAALRALFSIETPAAKHARTTHGDDADSEIRTLRLTLHRLRGDADEAVARRARRSYVAGTTSAERLAGARLMGALPAAPPLGLALVVLELGGGRNAQVFARRLLGGAPTVRDRGQGRLAAAEALLGLLALPNPGASRREGMLEIAVEWLAHPERDGGRQIDEEARTALFTVLPDFGATIVPAVTRRLRENCFEDPSQGVRLLLGLKEDVALEALQALAREAKALERPVLGAVLGGFRDLGKIGDAALAEALTAPAMPNDVRMDATLALAGDDATFAWPLLERLLRDPDAAVSSKAKDAVEVRGGPKARHLLEAVLLEGRWPAWGAEALRYATTSADPAAYEFLDLTLTRGPQRLRTAIFDEISSVRSKLRGPAAVRLVRRGIEEDRLGLDVAQIAAALASVDGPAAVAWVRARWRTWRSPEPLIRDLQIVSDPGALDFALELAAELRDDQEGLLNQVVTVLCGACPKVPARTDPLWRRLLERGSPSIRRSVVDALPGIPHGPMAALLAPWVADRAMDASVRRAALLACAPERDQPRTALLWTIASDRIEDPDLRAAAAQELLRRGDPRLRPLALAWLSERIDEWSEAVEIIAELAGRGASASEASDLLQLLRDDLGLRYKERPYFHRRRGDGEEEALGNRARSLIRAIAASGDSPSLDALASHLFDPRFATWSWEASRCAALQRAPGGGPLSPLADPPTLEVLLRHAAEDPNDSPIPPIPPEAAEIAEALAHRGPEEAAKRIARALAEAQDSGRLADFHDLYLLWLATGMREPGARKDRAPAEGAARLLEEAMARTAPAFGAEELVALDARCQEAERAGRFQEGAARALETSALAARTGLVDLPPTRWLAEGRPPGPSWRAIRARADFLAGAAAAVAGKGDEARDAFRAGLARAPRDPETLRGAAVLQARSRFDLEGAEALARRAAEMERREGQSESRASQDALARVEAARRAKSPAPSQR